VEAKTNATAHWPTCPVASPPTFTETDPDPIISALISDYEGRTSRTLFDGDPVRLLLLTIAYELARQRSQIQEAAEQNLIQFATGDNLEFLADLYGLSRRPAQKATTTLEFSTGGSPAGSNITVPKGTKAASEDGSVVFKTDEEVILQSGDTTVTAAATAVDAGTQANDLVAGQVKTLVNSISGISSVQNTTETTGGADQESDNALRERARAEPERFAVAGPRTAYVETAKAARADVVDVSVFSPSKGEVEVYPLLENGQIPGADALREIELALSANDTRPLTDRVFINAATPVSYTVDVEYVIYESDQSRRSAIDAAVEDAAQDYQEWQRRRIGRDLTPDFLIGQILDIDGIKKVTVNSPTDTVLSRTEVAQQSSQTLTFAGYEMP